MIVFLTSGILFVVEKSPVKLAQNVCHATYCRGCCGGVEIAVACDEQLRIQVVRNGVLWRYVGGVGAKGEMGRVEVVCQGGDEGR